ncbi:UNVERIFIED_CONTAM: hypothetical protein Scaly_2812500 [Sesamum calycinum]|uniref:Uncharacterized protein n=1 Tax=Sesamum calycinum TaxID=2727403 RepID=A0AAW2IW25_9LAMI
MGMDTMGPFPLTTGQRKFLLVAIDYFTKWLEQNLWPISLKGSYEADGEVEVTNRILVQGIKKRLDMAGSNWIEELTSVLWSYRTTPRGSTGENPFSLVYGIEALIQPNWEYLHTE